MKLIHCADLHLDSKMTANLNAKKASERKRELLHTFQRMVSYAKTEGVQAILIAGDMFDTKYVSKTTRNVVLGEIERNTDITFYYLRGNHDTDSFITDLETTPCNLKTFTETWSCYELGAHVRIYGAELLKENSASLCASLLPDAEKINIVMLHGQETETKGKDKAEIVPLRTLKNKGIDYLALGHVHAYKKESLDARGVYCYPGCLEGRGFDECGQHGFVLLEIEEKTRKIESKFIPFAARTLYTVSVNIESCQTSLEMTEKIRAELKKGEYPETSLMKVVLTGEVDVACEKNIGYIQSIIESDFYFVKIQDETTLYVDIEEYALDVSLKGEFVRLVKEQTDLKEEEKNKIIRYGLQILEGDKVVEI